jgi:hypothetical protein
MLNGGKGMDTSWIYLKLDSIIERISNDDVSPLDIPIIESDLLKINRCKNWALKDDKKASSRIDEKIFVIKDYIYKKTLVSNNVDEELTEETEEDETESGENAETPGKSFREHLNSHKTKIMLDDEERPDDNTPDVDSFITAFEKQINTNAAYWIKQVEGASDLTKIEDIKWESLALYKQYNEFLEDLPEEVKFQDWRVSLEEKLLCLKNTIDDRESYLKFKFEAENIKDNDDQDNDTYIEPEEPEPEEEVLLRRPTEEIVLKNKPETENKDTAVKKKYKHECVYKDEVERLQEEIADLRDMINELSGNFSAAKKHSLLTEKRVKVLEQKESQTLSEKTDALEAQAIRHQRHVKDMIDNLLIQIQDTRIAQHRERAGADRKLMTEEQLLNLLSIVKKFSGEENIYQSLKEIFRIHDLSYRLTLVSEKLLVFQEENREAQGEKFGIIRKKINHLINRIRNAMYRLEDMEQALIPGGFARFSIKHFFEKLTRTDEKEIDSFTESYAEFIRDQLGEMVGVTQDYYDNYLEFIEQFGARIFDLFEEINSGMQDGEIKASVKNPQIFTSINGDIMEILNVNLYCKLIEMPERSIWDDRKFYPVKWINDETLTEPIIDRLVTRGLFLEFENNHVNMKRYLLPGRAIVRGPEDFKRYVKTTKS